MINDQLQAELYRFELQFKEPAMTSRGTYVTHTVWYPVLKWLSPQGERRIAVGECAPLPDLSADFLGMGATAAERQAGYEGCLQQGLDQLWQGLRQGRIDLAVVQAYSSMRFGLECLTHLYERLVHADQGLAAEETAFDAAFGLTSNSVSGSVSNSTSGLVSNSAALLWDTPFSRGQCELPINGLIWMGSFEEMSQRISAKLQAGYHCIKLKIGALDFARELELLARMRERFSADQLELRVDANGAFAPDEVRDKLAALSQLALHSIEQPIKAGQWELMAQLCAHSPLAIGLDEELIGVNAREDKLRLLKTIKPQYLILKPSLHGGLSGCAEWMQLAQEHGIGYWVTSALESNIGLNALAQWCSTQKITMPQGLGTGLLYTNNVEGPLAIRQAQLHCDLAALGDYDAYVAAFLAKKAQLVAQWSA